MVQMSEDDFKTVYEALHMVTDTYTIHDVEKIVEAEARAWQVVQRVAEANGVSTTGHDAPVPTSEAAPQP